MEYQAMNAAELNARLIASMEQIRLAEEEYRRCIQRAANTEKAYKRRQAIAITTIRSQEPVPKNAAELDARAELLQFEDGATIGDLRFEAHLAAGLQDAAKLALRNRGQELSALQSEASLSRAEAEFIRTGPHSGS